MFAAYLVAASAALFSLLVAATLIRTLSHFDDM